MAGGGVMTEWASIKNIAAKENFQALTGGVSASTDFGLADRHATCFWHIKAPKGMRVEIRVRSLNGACADGCFYGGTEIKIKDFQRVGARICCRSDIRQLGILFSEGELAIYVLQTKIGFATKKVNLPQKK